MPLKGKIEFHLRIHILKQTDGKNKKNHQHERNVLMEKLIIQVGKKFAHDAFKIFQS